MIEKLIPSIDKLKHFFLWSIFLAICLHIANYLFMPEYYAYITSISSAILWELIQKLRKGTNSIKEMSLDVFFGGILPCILHIISK